MIFFRKIIVLKLFVLNFFGFLFAESSSLFHFDEQMVIGEFRSISQLENHLWENDFLLNSNENNLSESLGKFNALPIDSPDFNIPAFYWGFVPGFVGGFFAPCSYGGTCMLGPAGVLMGYLIYDKNKEESKKSIYGCVSGTALGAMTSISLIIFIYGTMLFSSGLI